MMFICIKQHLSNIWSWILEKVKLTLRLPCDLFTFEIVDNIRVKEGQ